MNPFVRYDSPVVDARQESGKWETILPILIAHPTLGTVDFTLAK